MTVTARKDVPEAAVTVGVDTHLDSHVAVAVDDLGRRLGEMHVPTTVAGYAKMLGWATALGALERVGIEGAGSFGAGLSRFLRASGVEVGRPKRRDFLIPDSVSLWIATTSYPARSAWARRSRSWRSLS